jgi:uncharacterized protein YigA (DUF484 family)
VEEKPDTPEKLKAALELQAVRQLSEDAAIELFQMLDDAVGAKHLDRETAIESEAAYRGTLSALFKTLDALGASSHQRAVAHVALIAATQVALIAGTKDPKHFARLKKTKLQEHIANARAAKASKNLDKQTIDRIVAEQRDLAAKRAGGRRKIQIAERAWESTNAALAAARKTCGLDPLDEPYFKNADTLRKAHDRLKNWDG